VVARRSSVWLVNVERMRMLLNGDEIMDTNKYVIPTAVLQRLLDAAAARYVRLLLRYR